MALSDLACRNAKPGASVTKLSDGGGLQLWVQPGGTKLWRLAYRFGGKQKLLALGAYPLTTLADARRARDDNKRLLAAGSDPSEARKAEKRARHAPGTTFREIADEYVAKLKREGRAEATLSKTEWLLSFAYPTMGSRNIREITAPDVLHALRTVESRGRHESARRMRSTVGAVFRYAIATARADTDPTLALQGALTRPTVVSRAAPTDPKALGGLLRAIDAFEGQATTRGALRLLPLLFPRPGELRAAEWSEFDLEARVWSIPASRMKMRRPHRVPLSKQAVAILTDLKSATGWGVLVFPSVRTVRRPISDNTLNAALRRLGFTKDEVTAHGFRATASTLLNESGKWSYDAIERQLAHIETNDVRRAYARGDHWQERTEMMQWWADYIESVKAA